MTENIKTAAPKILEIIQASKNILLYCHPAPDPDSVGSALAMKFALEQLGKKATVIRGDGPMPETAFSSFPGFADIVPKNFLEITASATGSASPDGSVTSAPFDLFIVQDAGSLDRVSALGKVVIPPGMKTIVIDHHISSVVKNVGFGSECNLIEPSYPATALILFDLFKMWNIRLTPDIAANLFIGMYTDTGGFKYASVTSNVFAAAAELTAVYPDFHKIIFSMENMRQPAELTFEGLAFLNIKTFFDGRLAMAAVSHEDMAKHSISAADTSSSLIANIVKSVVGWDIGACLVEKTHGNVYVSFRTRDSEKYDLSLLASSLGGGGHKAAAAAVVLGTIEEVMNKVVDAARATVLH
jgi:phosphoesterase RecJ-like protein